MKNKIIKSACILSLLFSAQIAMAKPNNNNLKTLMTKYMELAKNSSLTKDLSINIYESDNAIVLTGKAENQHVAHKLEELARFVFNAKKPILNLLKVEDSQQVMLRVKFGEIKKDVLKDYGSKNLSENLELLEKKGVFKMYAQPTLIALSGKEAKFETGGEVPVYKGKDSVKYKSHGVKLKFLPEILAGNRIRLQVKPEITEIVPGSKAGNIMNLPSFSTHQAETTVDLAPGESFMIAGLVKNVKSLQNVQTGIFSSKKGGKSEDTELVIAVTPYIVAPTESSEIKMPNENFNLDKEFSKLLNRHNEAGKLQQSTNAGYLID